MTPEGGDCTKPKLTPLNDGVIVDVTCTGKDGKQTPAPPPSARSAIWG